MPPKIIPKDWINCPRKSSLIANKFVAFKTPLDDNYTKYLQDIDTFTPDNLFEWMSILKYDLGLWFDLTNTQRYYHPTEVLNNGCEYKKLQCVGHGVTPPPDLVKVFIHDVDNFIKRHPRKVIGIHCTHGFNRTGYLIVSYLVLRMKYSVYDALSLFSECRPPGIYRDMYVADLINKYGTKDRAMPIVRQPNWLMHKRSANSLTKNKRSTRSRSLRTSQTHKFCKKK